MHCSLGYWREIEADSSAALESERRPGLVVLRRVGGLVKKGYCSSSRPETLLLTPAVGKMTLWFSNLDFPAFPWQNLAKILKIANNPIKS